MMRADYYRTNRSAAHWRAVVIQAMRIGGMSYAAIGDWFLISAERARQICSRPLPAAQLEFPINQEQP